MFEKLALILRFTRNTGLDPVSDSFPSKPSRKKAYAVTVRAKAMVQDAAIPRPLSRIRQTRHGGKIAAAILAYDYDSIDPRWSKSCLTPYAAQTAF
jgi:hypothetical protein